LKTAVLEQILTAEIIYCLRPSGDFQAVEL